MDFSWQAAAFDDHVASGALTLEFAAERQRLEGRIERFQAQHTDVVRDKSAAENKSRRLSERLAAAKAEKEDLRRQLAEERRDANRACAEAQAAQAEAKLARAKASLAHQRTEEMETRLGGLCDRLEKWRPRHTWRSSRRIRSSWTCTGSWVRGPLPSKRLVRRWASASLGGYRRS
jgi:chromosome segregation ATPase